MVMLTSLGSGNEARLAYDSGIEAYLTKPVRQAELVDALARVLLREAPSAPVPLISAPGRRAHVLVVEDNVVNQEVARAMLTELGCSLRVASDGREALAALRDDVFDLVFMPIFSRMRARYTLTVFGLSANSSAISDRRLPDAINRKVWNSRSESFSCGATVSSGAFRFSMSACAISGVTYFLPAITIDNASSSLSGALPLLR